MIIKEYKIDEDISIKDFILKRFSKKYYRFLKRQNAKFYLNGEFKRTHEMSLKNDILKIEFDSPNVRATPFKLNLDIIYEDEDIIVVNKPSNLNSIPSRKDGEVSLYNALISYTKNLNTIHLISRLDKETEGLVLVALNKEAALFLNKNKPFMNKIYMAIVEGIFQNKEGMISKPIAKASDGIKREISSLGKEAITSYKVIGEKNNQSLLRIKLYTGRTHQIRVHMKSIGHPLVGDSLYGTKDSFGLRLCASELTFKNMTNEEIHLKIKPEWMDSFE